VSKADFSALGLRAHSGWAALVAVAGTPSAIEVVARRRIEIADPAIPGSKQPYHEAEELTVEKAARLLDRCERGAERLARQAFGEVLEELAKLGHEPRACGLLMASGRPLPPLAAILASHALIHTADGEHFREALARASEHSGLPVVRVREKEVLDRAATALGVTPAALQRRVQEMGRAIGPPWTQDQKLATLVAWIALTSASQRSPRTRGRVPQIDSGAARAK
jgi:hypothetical protein